MKFLDKRVGIPINLETPYCVLAELSLSLKKRVCEQRLSSDDEYRIHVLHTLRQMSAYELQDEFGDADLAHIALFVNPEEYNWNIDQLLEAFTWIQRIMETPKLVRSNAVGYPTPEKPYSSSVAHVYRYLVKKGMQFNSNASEVEIFAALSSFDLRRDYLFNQTLSRLASLRKKEIAEFHRLVTARNRTPKPVNWERVRLAVLEHKTGSRQGLYPSSSETAIAIAALRFGKDISSFNFPIEIYWELVQGFFPVDGYAKQLLEVDGKVYDLAKNFNPNLPQEAYADEVLYTQCATLGLLRYQQPERNYQQLVGYHLANNFHIGLKVGTSLESPLGNKDLRSVPETQVLTYGSYGNRFTSYTVKEITWTFETNEYFYDLHDGLCNSEAIAQLEVMCRKMIRKPNWKKLLETIALVKKKMVDIKLHQDEFFTWYATLTDTEQKQAQELLTDVLYLGLRFRNWTPGEKWPVAEVPPYDSNVAAFNSADELDLLCDKLSAKDNVTEKIAALRLIYVEAITHTLLLVNLHREGLNILQRLRITQERVHYDSCIRLTSTRLIATAYVFLSAVGAPLQQEEEFRCIEITI